jgi:hypothetical protein
MEDTSLDEFLGAGGDGETDDGGVAEAGTDDGGVAEAGTDDAGPDADATPAPSEADEGVAGPRVSPAAVDRARPTFQWSPDGAACVSCGETVRRRWQSGSGLVCVECTDW